MYLDRISIELGFSLQLDGIYCPSTVSPFGLLSAEIDDRLQKIHVLSERSLGLALLPHDPKVGKSCLAPNQNLLSIKSPHYLQQLNLSLVATYNHNIVQFLRTSNKVS